MSPPSSSRRVNERTILLTDKTGDTILDTRQIEVSQDGKTLTMTIHVQGRTDPNVLVFDKQ